ncbi:MAG: amidohydrolase family protein [Longimicrobiales bacterium]
MSGPPLLLALMLALPQQAVRHPLPPLTAQPPGVLAVVGATLYPVSGPPIAGGVMLVEGGRITAVGEDVAVPSGARVLDVAGMTVMPGLVESHSHMGLKQLFRPETGSDNNELSKPINAEVRAIDGFAAQDPGFRVALMAGVTTMNVTTGSRSFASGQAAVVKLRGRSAEEMWVAPGGLKFAMRVASRNQWGTRVPEILELLRAKLTEARAYESAKSAHARGDVARPPAWDPQLEALGRALSGEWPVGVHAHGAPAMQAAIALKDEFGLDLYIHHADATLELAEELAAKGIPISYGPTLPFSGRHDPALAGPVRLAELGGSVSFHQDHPDGPQYYLRHSAALFVRHGMPPAVALRALTLEPARLFGLEDRIGSLEPGKDADFIVLDGPPLDWESRVRRVFIEGVEVYRLGEDGAPAPVTSGDGGRG